MPAPGEQYGAVRSDYRQEFNMPSRGAREFTAQERLDIRTKLNQQLGPEYISHRVAGGGMRVPYLEGWKVINLANDVFGFYGWNSEIKSVNIDFCDESNGRINLGVTVMIRVTLRDGTFREDVGFGQVENVRSKGMAFDKCRKEATTDALKRALRQFGNALGNCLYDSSYTKNVGRMKVNTPNFDPDQLLRRPEFMPTAAPTAPVRSQIKPEPAAPSSVPVAKANGPVTTTTVPQKTPHPAASSVEPEDFDRGLPDIYSDELDCFDEIDGLPYVAVEPKQPVPALADAPEKVEATEPTPPLTTPVRFVSARAAEAVQSNSQLPANAQFDPGFQSPLIRRTLPHNMSVPVKRPAELTPGQQFGAPPVTRSNQRSREPHDLGPSAVNLPPQQIKTKDDMQMNVD